MSEGQSVAARAEAAKHLVDEFGGCEWGAGHWQRDRAGLCPFLKESLNDGVVVRLARGLDQEVVDVRKPGVVRGAA